MQSSHDFSFATNIRLLYNRPTNLLIPYFFFALVFHNTLRKVKVKTYTVVFFFDIPVAKIPIFQSKIKKLTLAKYDQET